MSTSLPQVKRRHHYIPRFLLKRFASRQHHGKSWIWQLSAHRPPREISTKDAAVTKFFYGPDGRVEDRLALAEAGFRVALHKMDGGASPAILHRELREFVWLQNIRTKALRQHFYSTVEALVHRMLTWFVSNPSKFKDMCIAYVRNNFESHMESVIGQLPPTQRMVASSYIKDPMTREHLIRTISHHIKRHDMLPTLHQFRDICSTSLEKGAIQGHQEAMLRTFPEATVHIPDHFQPCGWKLIRADRMSQSRFILGDICVLAAAEGGDGGPLFKWGKSWKELYVPIAPDKVLFAGADEGVRPSLSMEGINRLSAKTAFSHVFASRVGERERSYVNQIGSGPLLTEEEMIALLGEVLGKENVFGC